MLVCSPGMLRTIDRQISSKNSKLLALGWKPLGRTWSNIQIIYLENITSRLWQFFLQKQGVLSLSYQRVSGPQPFDFAVLLIWEFIIYNTKI